MRGGETPGRGNLLFPVTGETCGFVDVSVQGDARLTPFDEAPDGHAPDMNIQRCMINGLPV